MLADLRAELVTIRQENGRLESHSNSVDQCLASLKEENQRLGESLANTVCDMGFCASYIDLLPEYVS